MLFVQGDHDEVAGPGHGTGSYTAAGQAAGLYAAARPPKYYLDVVDGD